MALLINTDCINCDVCVAECPNQAISEGSDIYVIDPQKCTECVGHHDDSQCVAVCPVNCIEPDPSHVENAEDLLKKFMQLTASPA